MILGPFESGNSEIKTGSSPTIIKLMASKVLFPF